MLEDSLWQFWDIVKERAAGDCGLSWTSLMGTDTGVKVHVLQDGRVLCPLWQAGTAGVVGGRRLCRPRVAAGHFAFSDGAGRGPAVPLPAQRWRHCQSLRMWYWGNSVVDSPESQRPVLGILGGIGNDFKLFQRLFYINSQVNKLEHTFNHTIKRYAWVNSQDIHLDITDYRVNQLLLFFIYFVYISKKKV